MRFENGLIFVNGRFVPGGFSVENGRFAHVLADAADAESVDLHGARVIPGWWMSTPTATPARTFPTGTMTAW